jgi:hypothetical protein
MGTNILDLVKGQLSDMLLSKAAGFLGEDNAATTKAMNLILPSILGGMANKATNAEDASQLFGLMQNVAWRWLGNTRFIGNRRECCECAFWQ